MAELRSPFKRLFYNPYSLGLSPKSKYEWLIIDISNIVRSRENWWNLYKQDELREEWSEEILSALQSNPKYNEDPDYNEQVFKDLINFVLEELEFYEFLKIDTEDTFQSIIDDRIFTSISDYKGDNFVVNDELKQALKDTIAELLEDPSGGEREFHLDAGSQIHNLVDPFIYPLQYGKTAIIDSDDIIFPTVDKNKLPLIKPEYELSRHSEDYQLLPSTFKVKSKFDSATGKSQYNTIISSYINNLHPVKNERLYALLSQLFSVSVPGLNASLSRLASPEYRRIKFDYDNAYDINFLDKMEHESSEAAKQKLWATRGDYMNKVKIKYSPTLHNRNSNRVDVSKFDELKVITKISKIELTPENPVYRGSNWQFEGTVNEDIIANIVYYYDVDNIKESKISLRLACNIPEEELEDEIFLKRMYNIKSHLDSKLYQSLASSNTIDQNHIMIFPNIFQFRIDPFELEDKTRKGHRKIIHFYIVDPYNDSIISTDRVPPQQKSWWDDCEEGTFQLKDLLTKEIITKIKDIQNKESKVTGEGDMHKANEGFSEDQEKRDIQSPDKDQNIKDVSNAFNDIEKINRKESDINGDVSVSLDATKLDVESTINDML